MPVLRSRVIPSPQKPTSASNPKFLTNQGFIEPSTPAKTVEPLLNQSPQETSSSPNFTDSGFNTTSMSAPPPRRSLRLASKSDSGGIASRGKRQRSGDFEEGDGGGKSGVQSQLNVEVGNLSDSGGLGEENGVRVSDSEEERGVGEEVEEKGVEESEGKCRKRGRSCGSELEEIERKLENGCLSLRSGTRIVKRNVGSEVEIGDELEVQDVKGKGVLIEAGGEHDEVANESNLDDDENDDGSSHGPMRDKLRSAKRFTREEKGKGILLGFDDVNLDKDDPEMPTLSDNSNEDLNTVVNGDESIEFGGSVNYEAPGITLLAENRVFEAIPIKSRMEVFKDIARKKASKFAYFNEHEDEEENHVDSEGEAEDLSEQPAENVEDWPGPFCTARKIIKDREKNLSSEVKKTGSRRGGMALISWTPRRERDDHLWPKREAPSLQDLCLSVLAKNVDAITSLTYVPDVLRHKLTQILCDSRRMNGHFLDLLLDGSPSELRLPDCSWLEEEKFEKSFESCNTINLTVLQLDLCGHCLSDSSLLKALVPKGLPSLTMVSLKGACRISDIGLKALVSSAPALHSMNLSQCSLLTDDGINSVADLLGSILRELYLDDCESLLAMRILPALQKLQHLEVLSLRGICSVSDRFIKQLIASNGQNMKELHLANCVKLSDSSLKVIAETCSQLYVLDLSHLTKLTDIGMVYLANGCLRLQDLKLCRSKFSDDAIAAFLEASGESLIELSLNNILKVGQNTAISLSSRCKNLQSLDLSWCRNLTDEALGLIADSCSSLKVLKLFGCTQVTRTFLEGHSNPQLQIIGMNLTPILTHIKRPEFQQGPLHYSAVPSF